MKRLVAIAALVGCNDIYGLDKTHLPHRHVGCPAPDDETLRFSPELTQVAIQTCTQFHVTGTHAAGRCSVNGIFGIYFGGVDEALVQATGLPLDTSVTTPYRFVGYLSPFASRDGTRVYMTRFETTTTASTVSLIVYSLANGTWSTTPARDRVLDNESLVGVIDTPAGDRVVTVKSFGEMQELSEWQFVDAAWQVVRTTDVTALLGPIDRFAFTSDGLRGLAIVVNGDFSASYLDRDSLDAPFRIRPVVGAPSDVSTEYALADDCNRLYVTGLDSIWYAEQE